MKIRALSVDDEPLAREQIRSLFREERDVELIGTCDAGEPAIEFILHGLAADSRQIPKAQR